MTDRSEEYVLVSNGEVSSYARAIGRKMLRFMYTSGHLALQSMTRTLADGTTIIAQRSPAGNKIIVKAPPTPESKPVASLSSMWVPRGFVVYPASSAFPQGFGLPVAQSGTDPYDPANLAPGVDSSRWTAGGACGQVLLTRDTNAGYPASSLVQMAPITYTDKGATFSAPETYDARADSGVWGAYRMEQVDFIAHYPKDDRGSRRTMFADLNTQRAAGSVAAAYLWPRGFYRPAESTAYMMAANGVSTASSAAYPAEYQDSGARVTKDGPWSAAATTQAGDQGSAGYGDPRRVWELQAVGGAADSILSNWTVAQSAQLLYASPDGLPVFADVGYCGGYWCLVLEERDQWIQAGRRSYQPQDATLPPISWEAPPSKNTYMMFWPAAFSMSGGNVVAQMGAQFVMNGAFAQKQYQSQEGFRPLLGRFVYCRGRAIAVLPNDGYVLGAAVASTATNDRLLVLAWHASENTGDWQTAGLCNVVHLWAADFPRTGALRLHPTQLVFETGTGAYQWQDGGTQTLPGIKYDSLWEFNADATKAVCLRDIGVATDFTSTATAAVNAGVVVYEIMYSGRWAAVEALIGSPAPTLSLVTTNLDTNANNTRAITVLPHTPAGLTTVTATEWQVAALAAGYDTSGNVIIAYTGVAALSGAGTVGSFAQSDVEYVYCGIGNTATLWAEDLSYFTLVSATSKVPENDFMWTGLLQVVDLNEALFVVDGYNPHLVADYTTYTNGSSPSMTYTLNAAWPTAMTSTSSFVQRVRMWHKGTLVSDASFPHPTPDVWNLPDLRERLTTGSGTGVVLASIVLPSTQVQPFYATRFGEVIYGYQCGLAAPFAYVSGLNNAPNSDQYAASSTFGTISAAARLPVGGYVNASFSLPSSADIGWLNEVVVV